VGSGFLDGRFYVVQRRNCYGRCLLFLSTGRNTSIIVHVASICEFKFYHAQYMRTWL